MKDFRCISLHFYFKILDAELFGGTGSEGFVKTGVCESIGSADRPIEEIISLNGFNRISNKYIELLSKQMKISKDKVIQISRDEYLENADDELDDEDTLEIDI